MQFLQYVPDVPHVWVSDEYECDARGGLVVVHFGFACLVGHEGVLSTATVVVAAAVTVTSCHSLHEVFQSVAHAKHVHLNRHKNTSGFLCNT